MTWNWTFAKWPLGLLQEGKILFFDFSFLNLNHHPNNELCRFFKEIEE